MGVLMSHYFSVRKLFFIVVIVSIGWTPLTQADPPKGYAFGGYDQALRKAASSGKRIFLYYGRHGCGFCDMTNKDAFSKKEIKQRYTQHYELIYIDSEGGQRMTLPSGERITEQQFGARQHVLGTPYFLFMEADGSPIFKVPGYKTAKDLILMDDYIHGNHYKTKSFNKYSNGRT